MCTRLKELGYRLRGHAKVEGDGESSCHYYTCSFQAESHLPVWKALAGSLRNRMEVSTKTKRAIEFNVTRLTNKEVALYNESGVI